MAAYRKDVEGNASADLTSIAITKRLKDDNLSLKEGSSKKIWYEAKSKEGHIYYWNTLTNGKFSKHSLSIFPSYKIFTISTLDCMEFLV